MKVRFKMKAVITVTGKDSVGIIANVASECAKYDANIVDISQSVLSEYFAMIMLADIDRLSVPFSDFVDTMALIGKDKGLDVHVMHEDIFNTMHHI
jgi:ACT domain-containing protein